MVLEHTFVAVLEHRLSSRNIGVSVHRCITTPTMKIPSIIDVRKLCGGIMIKKYFVLAVRLFVLSRQSRFSAVGMWNLAGS